MALVDSAPVKVHRLIILLLLIGYMLAAPEFYYFYSFSPS